jgi:anti-sigma B factor antagonist
VAHDLEISVRADPTRVLVELGGELDASSIAELERVADDVLANVGGATRVELDLERLEFCDSAGVYVFIRMEKAARDRGLRLVLTHPHGMVARLFEVANMAESVEIA